MAEQDLHVRSLVYVLKTSEGLIFADPPPLDFETESFSGRLKEGKLTLTMKNHYAACEEAKTVVASFLLSWELSEATKRARREMWFEYEGCDVIDRADAHAAILVAGSGSLTLTGMPAVLTLTQLQYPAPPTDFEVTPEVEILWTLYEDQQAGRVRLTDLAYFGLTVLEDALGNGSRTKLAARLHIDPEILNTLGKLVSGKGDARTARKMPRGGWKPHAPGELTWILDVVRALIRRAGERNPAGLKKLTMADFRSLTD